MKDAKVGEPVHGSSYTPEEKDIPRIKSVVVTEFEEDKHWVGSNLVSVDNTLFASLLN